MESSDHFYFARKTLLMRVCYPWNHAHIQADLDKQLIRHHIRVDTTCTDKGRMGLINFSSYCDSDFYLGL